ncbi:hypothetical protein TrCOL_g4063 [Triparma columacea]|uniref:Uncharacterized protein n=1 Tax=Triparma columacea TaxID=722753 RepID=A0A9W7GKC7_9STRA|nr:hypothetical protein TrCOL_g4063 [Triparma columacea]
MFGLLKGMSQGLVVGTSTTFISCTLACVIEKQTCYYMNQYKPELFENDYGRDLLAKHDRTAGRDYELVINTEQRSNTVEVLSLPI